MTMAYYYDRLGTRFYQDRLATRFYQDRLRTKATEHSCLNKRFVTCCVLCVAFAGRSFLYHQILKMMGLVLAVAGGA